MKRNRRSVRKAGAGVPCCLYVKLVGTLESALCPHLWSRGDLHIRSSYPGHIFQMKLMESGKATSFQYILNRILLKGDFRRY